MTSRNGTRGTLVGNSLWTSDPVVLQGASGATLADPGPAYGGQAFQVTWHAAQ